MIRAIFVLACVICFSSANAEETERGKCDAVLVKNTLIENSESRLALSILQTLDQDSFEQIKKNGGFDLGIPIDGIPIDLSGSWDNFQEQRSHLSKLYKYNYDSATSRNIVIASASPQAIDAWSECMKTNTRETLITRPRFQSDRDIFVDVFWTPGAGLEAGNLENVKVIGGRLVGKAPRRFLAKWTTLQFIRDSARVGFAASINIKRGDAGIIAFPAARRMMFTSSLACREWGDAGCLTCAVSLANYTNISPGGGLTTFLCRDMVPKAIAFAELNARFQIDGGGSSHDWVGIRLNLDRHEEAQSDITDVQSPITFRMSTSRSVIDPNGIAAIEIFVSQCQWNDLYDASLHKCTVSATPDSEILVHALGPGSGGRFESVLSIDSGAIANRRITPKP